MKLLIDHNLPHWWADTLRPFCQHHLASETHALQDLLPKNATDLEVFEFANKGDWVILTQDKYRHRLERDVIHAHKIKAYNFHGWQKFPMNEQLSKLFRAIPKIIENASTISGGGVFFVGYKNGNIYLP
jgi:predicted nuclease of predicted toxin-antitoxin system